MATADPVVVARAIQCLASTVVDGAIVVTVSGATEAGTSSLGGGTFVNEGTTIPAGWSSFTLINWVTSNDNVVLNSSLAYPPGASVAHDTWPGYPGEEISVSASDATYTISYVVPVPTP